MFNVYKKVYIIFQTKPEQKIVGCFENDSAINDLKRDGYEYKSVKIPYYKEEKLNNYDIILEDLCHIFL